MHFKLSTRIFLPIIFLVLLACNKTTLETNDITIDNHYQSNSGTIRLSGWTDIREMILTSDQHLVFAGTNFPDGTGIWKIDLNGNPVPGNQFLGASYLYTKILELENQDLILVTNENAQYKMLYVYRIKPDFSQLELSTYSTNDLVRIESLVQVSKDEIIMNGLLEAPIDPQDYYIGKFNIDQPGTIENKFINEGGGYFVTDLKKANDNLYFLGARLRQPNTFTSFDLIGIDSNLQTLSSNVVWEDNSAFHYPFFTSDEIGGLYFAFSKSGSSFNIEKIEGNQSEGWNTSIEGKEYETIKDFSIQPSGETIILGTYHNQETDDRDLIVIKLDSNGKKLWANTYGSEMHDSGRKLMVSPGGEIYILFSKSGSTTGASYFLLKLDSNGTPIE